MFSVVVAYAVFTFMSIAILFWCYELYELCTKSDLTLKLEDALGVETEVKWGKIIVGLAIWIASGTYIWG